MDVPIDLVMFKDMVCKLSWEPGKRNPGVTDGYESSCEGNHFVFKMKE